MDGCWLVRRDPTYNARFAFVEFADPAMAHTAVMLNGLQVAERTLRVAMAKSSINNPTGVFDANGQMPTPSAGGGTGTGAGAGAMGNPYGAYPPHQQRPAPGYVQQGYGSYPQQPYVGGYPQHSPYGMPPPGPAVRRTHTPNGDTHVTCSDSTHCSKLICCHCACVYHVLISPMVEAIRLHRPEGAATEGCHSREACRARRQIRSG